MILQKINNLNVHIDGVNLYVSLMGDLEATLKSICQIRKTYQGFLNISIKQFLFILHQSPSSRMLNTSSQVSSSSMVSTSVQDSLSFSVCMAFWVIPISQVHTNFLFNFSYAALTPQGNNQTQTFRLRIYEKEDCKWF